MTIGDCSKCRLPQIVNELKALRDIAQIAAANVDASEVVTERNPYLVAKNEALNKLSEKKKEYTEFVNDYRGICGRCEFGA